ncbi:MAG: ABC transporter permease, partial [Caulobacter sp. 35-67-4]
MLSAFLSPLVLIGLLLAGWEIACARLAVPAYLLPPPSAIGTALIEGWPLLLASAWGTLSTALLALVTLVIKT